MRPFSGESLRNLQFFFQPGKKFEGVKFTRLEKAQL